jgi:cell division protein FtsI/penicillin-binding protein 2
MELIDRRIGLLFLAFLGLLGFAAVRAAYLGSFRAPALQRAAASQQVQTITIPASRGTITDRHGMDLAVSQSADDVAATPYLVKDTWGTAQRLAPLLNRSVQVIAQRLSRRGGFVYLARQVPATSAQQIQKLKIPGLTLIPQTRRDYPQGTLASQLLGSVGVDGTGLSGLEYADDRLLHGVAGKRRVVNDALGQPISIQDMTTTRTGTDMRLTLDAPIQQKVEQVLQQVGQVYHPKGATALVMNPSTGSLLAVANWPPVDANNPGSAPDFARQDRAVGASYEPGSTFKALTVAGALEDHLVNPDTTFNVPPQLQVADRTIRDAEQHGYETLTTAQILARSSNIGADLIGQRLGARRFDYWVRRFGFGQPTGVDLPGEAQGIVPRLEHYSGSSMGNLPIGQGLAVTPIQMATLYAAVANGGILRPPRIVESVNGKPTPPAAGRRVISPATAASLRKMLEGVLGEAGTAPEATIPGYVLAGKTGTAQKPIPGGYSDTKFVASFVGFAPANHPRVLVAVMVDEPQGQIYGGVVAAPAFQAITSFILPYLRIPPG